MVITGYFFAILHPLPHKKLKNQNFEKMKKISGDIIILHMCTKNHNHKVRFHKVRFLRYAVRQTECFVILGQFFPFNPLKTHKIKIFIKSKKHPEMSSFYTCEPKITRYGLRQTEFFVILDYFLPFDSPRSNPTGCDIKIF